AVNNIRSPAQFTDRFDYALAEEDSAFVVVFVEVVLFIVEYGLAMEIVFVVDKVHLELCIRDRRHLDNQGFLLIAHRYVDPGKPYYFMQPVFALVNDSKTGNQNSDLHTFLLHRLWELADKLGHFRCLEESVDLDRYLKYSEILHIVRILFETELRSTKIQHIRPFINLFSD